jgi:sorting nexin-1/2
MQLDAEEDDSAFYKPPVEPTARPSGESSNTGPTAVDSTAAAVITAEDSD